MRSVLRWSNSVYCQLPTARSDSMRLCGDLLRATGLFVVVLSLVACATNPVTGSREFVTMSQAQEIGIGRENHAVITREMGIYDDSALQEYVENIGYQLAGESHRPDLPWQFTIVDTPVVNAFALPGGFIYLTRGLMAYLGDESELVGVMGHEIGHVTARHSVQAYTRAVGAQVGLVLGQIFLPAMRSPAYGVPGLGDAAGQGLGLLFLKFGRDDEIQADRLGAEYAAFAGWDPSGVGGMLTTLGRIADTTDRRGTPNWLLTHPEPEDRVEAVSGTVKDLLEKDPDSSRLRIERTGYLERINGLVYGDNPAQGVVRGREFLHPELRFALQFPEGWQVQNSPERVIAGESGRNSYMLLQFVNETGSSLRRIAEIEMTGAGFKVEQGTMTDVNGLKAYLGTYSQVVREFGTIIAKVVHIQLGSSVYMLGAFSPVADYQGIERDVTDSLTSFRQLTVSEATAIRPSRIAIYVVDEGDTWESLASRVGKNTVTASTLAIMNGYALDEEPGLGDRVKIVVSG